MKRIKYTQLFFLSFLIFITNNLFAEKKAEDDNKMPLGCQKIGYQFAMKTLILKPEKVGEQQSMYFLFNASNQSINLYQMLNEESSRSLYLNHSINPRQWAVLSTGEKQVKFICTVPEAKSRYGKIVDCAESIQVCEYAKVRYGLNNRGDYWIVKNNTRDGAIREVVRYGIIPAY